MRALARLGLVYEPEFSHLMMASLDADSQADLFTVVGMGPDPDRAVKAVCEHADTLCLALGSEPERADMIRWLLTEGA